MSYPQEPAVQEIDEMSYPQEQEIHNASEAMLEVLTTEYPASIWGAALARTVERLFEVKLQAADTETG